MTTSHLNTQIALPAWLPARQAAVRCQSCRQTRMLLGVILCFGVCLSAGCGPPGPKLVPVSGTLSLDGEPLAFKSILFLPEGDTTGNGAGGYTDGQGSYALIAVIFGATRDYAGCPPGRYRVVVSEPSIPITAADFDLPQGEDLGREPAAAIGPVNSPAARGVPAVYTAAQTTTLLLEVPESGGVVDLELTSGTR